MNKYSKTTKFFRKTFLSTPLNSVALNGRQKIRQFITQLEGKDICNHKSPTGQNNKSYDYENNKKYMQEPKIHQKSARSVKAI